MISLAIKLIIIIVVSYIAGVYEGYSTASSGNTNLIVELVAFGFICGLACLIVFGQ